MDKNEVDIASVVSRLMSDPGVTEAMKKLSGSAGESTSSAALPPSVGGIPGDELAKKLPEVMSLLKPMLEGAERGKGGDSESERRNRLLSALKPYLSDNRRDVIDKVTSLPDLKGISELLTKLKP